MNVWPAVDRLVDRAQEPAGLRAHGLQLLAARRWRIIGRVVPAELVADERDAAVLALTAPIVLARVRAILPGPIILLKGPEIAARYPDCTLRPFGDLDLLVPDAAAAHRALREAGFELVEQEGTAPRPHHLPPLAWSGLPLSIELHHRLRGPAWMTPPTGEVMFKVAIRSATGMDGLLTLPPPLHALAIAAHSWDHAPLYRLRDLVDVAVLTGGCDPSELDALARTWRVGRVWTMTSRAIEAILLARPRHTWSIHLWARHLEAVRERTVLELHLARWLGALWAPTPGAAVRTAARTIADEMRPLPGEPWSMKGARLQRAARHALLPISEHRLQD